MTAGWARPAYVPRICSGTSGWRWVRPLTGLVDHRLLEGDTEAHVTLPFEGAIGDHASGHGGCRVQIIWLPGVVLIVPEVLSTPSDVAIDGRRVRIDQEFGGVAAQTVRGIPGAMDPESVALPRSDPWEEAMPDMRRSLGQRDAFL